MAKGDMVIVVSKTIKKYVLKNYKVDNKKHILIVFKRIFSEI